MAAIRDRRKQSSLDFPDGDEPISVAQQHLQKLLRKQLHTGKMSVETALDQSREFAPAVTFKPMAVEVEGLHSLKQYQSKKEEHSHIDQLRELGLTSKEIELKLSCENAEHLLPCPPQKKKVKVEPSAQQERIEALKEKISRREELVKKPPLYTGAHHMSRHAMEIENSLFQDRGNPLDHLTVEDHHGHVIYPSKVIPNISSPSETDLAKSGGNDSLPENGCQQGIIFLPPQVIERNRLSEAEIRALPRFNKYSPGEPSKVLYLKNLHHGVTEEDLKAVFGGLEPCRKEMPYIRMMTGRMHGQAFVEFPSTEDATTCLKAVNGFMMKEKPVVICYGKAQK